MNYKNGELILPAEVLDIIQNYAEGEIIYIPVRTNKHKGWGESSGTKNMLKKRNEEICDMHKQGTKIIEIAQKYYLSEDSIRKIVKTNKID